MKTTHKTTRVTAGGPILIQADGVSTSKVVTKTEQKLGDFSPAKMALSLAIANADITSYVVVPEDVIITAGKTVNILATGNETTNASAKSGLFSTGLAGMAFGIGLSDADIKTEVNGQVTANQEPGAVVKLEFDPTKVQVLDFNNHTIDLAVALNSTAPIPHALKTGDKVSYSNRRGNSIGGLGDGQDYFVVVDPTSPNKIYLAETLAKAKAAETKLKNGETLTPFCSVIQIVGSPAI
jgi:plastocyanin